jgi:hypothetical protein
MKRKHAELIKAWADGAEIQQLVEIRWVNDERPIWDSHIEYRIKPEPKPDVYVFLKFNTRYGNISRGLGVFDSNIRVTIDGETGELKSAEVI